MLKNVSIQRFHNDIQEPILSRNQTTSTHVIQIHYKLIQNLEFKIKESMAQMFKSIGLINSVHHLEPLKATSSHMSIIDNGIPLLPSSIRTIRPTFLLHDMCRIILIYLIPLLFPDQQISDQDYEFYINQGTFHHHPTIWIEVRALGTMVVYIYFFDPLRTKNTNGKLGLTLEYRAYSKKYTQDDIPDVAFETSFFKSFVPCQRYRFTGIESSSAQCFHSSVFKTIANTHGLKPIWTKQQASKIVYMNYSQILSKDHSFFALSCTNPSKIGESCIFLQKQYLKATSVLLLHQLKDWLDSTECSPVSFINDNDATSEMKVFTQIKVLLTHSSPEETAVLIGYSTCLHHFFVLMCLFFKCIFFLDELLFLSDIQKIHAIVSTYISGFGHVKKILEKSMQDSIISEEDVYPSIFMNCTQDKSIEFRFQEIDLNPFLLNGLGIHLECHDYSSETHPQTNTIQGPDFSYVELCIISRFYKLMIHTYNIKFHSTLK